MTTHSQGPWIDVHAHPGRCFLGGLSPSSPFVALMGPDESGARVRSSLAGELAVVNSATVADLAVLGASPQGGLYASRGFEPGEAAADHNRQLDAVCGLLSEPDIHPILHPDDVDIAAARDGVGVFVSCEGADFLDGELDGLRDVFDKGARSITLVHYRVNELGDIQTEDAVHGGLTTFGREVIGEMNRLGMIVDLAHATFEATVDALDESRAPVMISHSHLARPGADHPRLLSVEHARVVADAGGVIGVWPAGVALETLDDYCDEICRMADVVGVQHLSIGTDLDANYRPVLTDYEQFPEMAASLEQRGMTAGEVDLVLGGNFLTLFTAVTQL